MAVQVSRRLGAGHVVVAARDLSRLQALADVGADALIELTEDGDATAIALAAAAAEVDVVIDYRGASRRSARSCVCSPSGVRSRALDWSQIGAVAGPSIELASVALRSANLRLHGATARGRYRPGCISPSLASLVDEIKAGMIGIRANTFRLADVERVWTRPDIPGEQTVLMS